MLHLALLLCLQAIYAHPTSISANQKIVDNSTSVAPEYSCSVYLLEGVRDEDGGIRVSEYTSWGKNVYVGDDVSISALFGRFSPEARISSAFYWTDVVTRDEQDPVFRIDLTKTCWDKWGVNVPAFAWARPLNTCPVIVYFESGHVAETDVTTWVFNHMVEYANKASILTLFSEKSL